MLRGVGAFIDEGNTETPIKNGDLLASVHSMFKLRRWEPSMSEPDVIFTSGLRSHKYIVAISRIEVNHDGYGGTAPVAMTWDNGSILKPPVSSLRVIVDHASLLGPLGFRDSSTCPSLPSLRRMWLSGPTVSTSP